MADLDLSGTGFASIVTAEVRAQRCGLPVQLQLKVNDVGELLAMNPQDFANRIRKQPKSDNVYVYEHPDPAFQLTFQLLQENGLRVITFLHLALLRMKVVRVLFISYSSKDRKWLEALSKYLGGLESEEMEIWDDRQIEASANWELEINRALLSAKAALLLVSQDFLTSEFISEKELPFLLGKAKTDSLKIFWVPLSASTVKDTEIIKLQAAVDDPAVTLDELSGPKRKKQYLRVYETIAAVLGRSN